MSKIDELYERASQKLEKEAAHNDHYKLLAAHLRNCAKDDVAVCMAVLDTGKTLEGAYKEIEKEAESRYRKNTKQKGVCISSEEAFAIVDKYYGIAATRQETPTQAEQTISKVVSLFDMM